MAGVETLQAPGAFGGWLRKLAVNVWLQHARTRKLQSDLTPDGNLPDQAHETLPPREFSLAVGQGVDRARRLRRSLRIFLVIDGLVVALLLTPYAVQGSLSVADYLIRGLPSLGRGFISAVGIGLSLAFGAWVLHRARRMAG